MITSGFKSKCNNSNASAPRRFDVGSLRPYLDRRATASCAVRPAGVAEVRGASWAKAEVVELKSLWPQTLFLLDTLQILRHILKTDVPQVSIIFDLVENRAPDGHLP